MNENRKKNLQHCISFVNLEFRLTQRTIKFCNKNNILGTILLAKEGINGTISGDEVDIDKTVTYLMNLLQINSLDVKYSFLHLKDFIA